VNWQNHWFVQLPSTQAWLRERARELPAGTCVVARTQTQGQGREQRRWESADGGLYFSFLLKPATLLPDLPWVLWWAVLATLETETQQVFQLKAPNDILSGGAKIAGLLIDSRITDSAPDYYICGVGINLNQLRFSSELADKVTSLKLISGRSWLLTDFLEAFQTQFHSLLNLSTSKTFAEYLLLTLGKRQVQISYNGAESMALKEYWHEQRK